MSSFQILHFIFSRLDNHAMTIRDLYHFHTVEILMEVAVQELQMIIKWAKQLSCFNALDADDQINLLSEGRALSASMPPPAAS
jgi:hypothetical protein